MQLGALEDDNILMEEQQAGHSIDENTVTVELLDIEEALRFDKLDVTLLKQNISKTINIFYDVERLYPAACASLKSAMRKLLDCLSIAFSRLFEIHQQTFRQLRQQTTKLIHCKNDSQRCSNSPDSQHKDREVVRVLGGCRIVDDSRGIQQLPLPVPCQRCLNNLNPIQPSALEREEAEDEKWEVEEAARELLSIGTKTVSAASFGSMIEAHMNSFKQKPSNTFDSSLQYSLTSLLRYFSECEKDVTQFINRKALEIPVPCEPAYEVANEIDSIRRQKNSKKQAAMRLLHALTQRNRAKIANLLETYLLDKAEQESFKKAQNLSKRLMFSHQGIQTQEASNNSALQQQMEQQTLQIHTLQTEKAKLSEEHKELEKAVENQKIGSRKQSELAHGLRIQLEVYRDNVKPMQEYIDSLTEDYNKLQQQLSEGAQMMDREKADQIIEASDILPELKDKLRSVLKNLTDKAPIKPKKRKPFCFRIGLLRAIESEDLNESFIKEIVDLRSRRIIQTRERTTDELAQEDSESENDTTPQMKHQGNNIVIREKVADQRKEFTSIAESQQKEERNKITQEPAAQTAAQRREIPPHASSQESEPKVVRHSSKLEKQRLEAEAAHKLLKISQSQENYLLGEVGSLPSENKLLNNCNLVSVGVSWEDTPRPLANCPNQEQILSESEHCASESSLRRDAQTQCALPALQSSDTQTDQSSYAQHKRNISSKLQRHAKESSVFRVQDSRRQQEPRSRLFPSLNNSIESRQQRGKIKNSVLASTEYTHSSIGQISRTEACEETESTTQQLNRTHLIKARGSRGLHPSLHAEDGSSIRTVLRASVLESYTSEQLQSINEIQTDVMKCTLYEAANPGIQKKRGNTNGKLGRAELENADVIKESMKEANFKQFVRDAEFEEGIDELKKSLGKQGVRLPQPMDRQNFRKFIRQQEEQHSCQCGTGHCEHLIKFTQAMRRLVEKYNGRRMLRIPLQKIGNILSNSEREA